MTEQERLSLGGPLPAGAVVVVVPRVPTPCAVPHFHRDGSPRSVPGQVYRTAELVIVLCPMHGRARFGV
jgi:hypothetical protein